MGALDRLTRICAWCAAALFVVTGFMLTYEVAARYFFTRPTIWAAELSQLCLIWGSLIAMPWLLQSGRHIAVDALFQLLPDKGKWLCELFVYAVIVVFSAFLTWHGFLIFEDSFMRGSTTGSMLNLPRWIAELAVPTGFFLLFCQSFLMLIQTYDREAGESKRS